MQARDGVFTADDRRQAPKRKISVEAEKWLSERESQFSPDTMTDRELLIFWWCVVLILNDRYGRKLDLLEWCMYDRGLDIPQKGAEILQKIRYTH